MSILPFMSITATAHVTNHITCIVAFTKRIGSNTHALKVSVRTVDKRGNGKTLHAQVCRHNARSHCTPHNPDNRPRSWHSSRFSTIEHTICVDIKLGNLDIGIPDRGFGQHSSRVRLALHTDLCIKHQSAVS